MGKAVGKEERKGEKGMQGVFGREERWREKKNEKARWVDEEKCFGKHGLGKEVRENKRRDEGDNLEKRKAEGRWRGKMKRRGV